MGSFVRILSKLKPYLGIVLICAGIFLAILGNYLTTVIVVIIMGAATFLAGSYFTLEVMDKYQTPTDTQVNIALAAWALIGVLMGFFFGNFRKFGLAILATCGGVFIGITFTTTFLI